jgi:hypothetical protein
MHRGRDWNVSIDTEQYSYSVVIEDEDNAIRSLTELRVTELKKLHSTGWSLKVKIQNIDVQERQDCTLCVCVCVCACARARVRAYLRFM